MYQQHAKQQLIESQLFWNMSEQVRQTNCDILAGFLFTVTGTKQKVTLCGFSDIRIYSFTLNDTWSDSVCVSLRHGADVWVRLAHKIKIHTIHALSSLSIAALKDGQIKSTSNKADCDVASSRQCLDQNLALERVED